MEYLRCLLVDDHLMLRDALAMVLASEYPSLSVQCVGTLRDASDALAREPTLDVVLLDLTLPDSQGVATLIELRRLAHPARIIVLSADERPETILASLEEGASGYIPKSADWAALQQALRGVLNGHIYLPDELMRSGYLNAVAAKDSSLVHVSLGLSSRQMDVLRLLVEGKSNKAIGLELDLAPSTVKTHVSAIFERLAVNSRTQAVVAAARMGLRLTKRQSETGSDAN